MKPRHLIFCAVLQAALLALLSACASTGAQRVPTVHITNTKSVAVFPAAYDEVAVDNVFLFTGAFGDQTFSCQAYVQCTTDGIFMQAFSDFGNTLLTISCDSEGHVTSSSDMIPEMLARYIVMDAQLAYYDFASVRVALERESLTFTQDTEGFESVRRVFSKDDLISEYTINKSNAALSVKNYLRNYEYNLTAYEE